MRLLFVGVSHRKGEKKMKYRKLGNTGLFVSEIAFGTIPVLQGSIPVLPDYFNLSEEEALLVMERAFSLGCNLYDTAIVPEYGDAEPKLGEFAKRIGRERIVISDKARFYDGNELYQAVYTSCENLGTYADLYFVHQVDAEHEEAVFQKGGGLDALTELKAEGKIRFAGLASHYYDILLRGAKDARVDVLQGSGNLLERGMLDRIRKEPLFLEKGLLINKVYAAGLLPKFFPVQTLIRFVLSYPISSALIGLGTVEQVQAAMAEPEKVKEPSLKELSFLEVLSVLGKSYTEAPISCDRCQCCSCPYGTDISTVFRQHHYFFLGKDHWALKKLALGIEESAERCRRCVEMPCLEQCPGRLRIPDEIKRVAKLVQQHRFYSGIKYSSPEKSIIS